MPEMPAYPWQKIARDGTLAILLSYLIWFVTNAMDVKLNKLIEEEAAQTEILRDIRYSLKADNGIVFRNNAR
jgi:hypothetical protein